MPLTASEDASTYAGLATALALDALDALGLRHQSLGGGILPRSIDRVIVGRAKTLLWMDFAHDDPDTYALELAAVDSIESGEIVVCATGDSSRSGIWGELLTTAAMLRGAEGVVTDGAIRDIFEMRRVGFPTFSRHVCAYDSFNRQKVVAYDVRVEIDGVVIEPGDLIVADCDGIAVIPAALISKVTSYALEKAKREDSFRSAVKDGMKLTTAYETFKVL
jgi:regulator of RNase E activity RraA